MSNGVLLGIPKIYEEISERHLEILIRLGVSIAKGISHSVHNIFDSQTVSKAAQIYDICH